MMKKAGRHGLSRLYRFTTTGISGSEIYQKIQVC